jgi:AhpD family alkylhydroperoxidase
MSQRTNHFQTTPDLTKKLVDLGITIAKSSVGKKIIHLIDVRASQMNGCAFCLDMHSKQAKMDGERELRLYHVAIWRESQLFDEKERAALELTEALTRIPEGGISDGLYEKVRSHFTEVEVSELAFAISSINAWNRLQILARPIPGSSDAAFGLNKSGLE